MSSINDLTQLLGLVRTSAGAASGRTGRSANSTSKKGVSGDQKLSRNELKALAKSRFQALVEEDGEVDEEKAIQLFVETILVWEFGKDILEKANVARVVDQVSAQIVGDVQLKAALLTQLAR